MSKFITRLLVTVMLISAILLLSSCSPSNIHIGENGNWWNGTQDTGISAVGPRGDKGDTGSAGVAGLNGNDGSDGKDGKTGADAPMPIFRYNLKSDCIEVSYNSGESWFEFPTYPTDSSLMGTYNYPLGSITVLNGTIENMGNRFISSEGYIGAVIPLADFKDYDTVILVPSSNTEEFGYSFLADDLVVDKAAKYAEGYYEVVWPKSDDPVTVSIPKDAKYLYVYYSSEGTVYLPSSIMFSSSDAIK